MQQQISVVTLGIADLAASRRFYVAGFGWRPVFENDEIAFYQMNGLVLGTWLADRLAADSNRAASQTPGAFALGHNVTERDAVAPLIDRLLGHGGMLLRAAEETFYGGMAGYLADPDGHAWEIAWNPHWAINPQGHVSFGL